MSGILLFIIGLLRLGRFIAFIPAPVITGFTSGIALIIFIGQIDNFLGAKTAPAESSLLKLIGYFKGGYLPDWHTIVLGLVVILSMRSEEHTSELQSLTNLVCRLLLEKKKKKI